MGEGEFTSEDALDRIFTKEPVSSYIFGSKDDFGRLEGLLDATGELDNVGIIVVRPSYLNMYRLLSPSN